MSKSKTKRGRPPHRDCVTAFSNGKAVIAVMLSADLAERLRVGGAGSFQLSYAAPSGVLALSRGRRNSARCVPAYENGRKVGFNLRRAFLPQASQPETVIVLPHEWGGDDTLLIDFTPLLPAKAAA